MIFYRISELKLPTLIQRYDKIIIIIIIISFLIQFKHKRLNFYRLSDAIFYDRINTIYQFIKTFLDKKKKMSILRNMEPLIKINKIQNFQATCSSLHEPRQAKKCLRTCAKYANSDHPAHAQSIIRAFALHSYIPRYPMKLLADREGPDQTARMRRLILTFAVRICPKTRFHFARPSNQTLILWTLSK